MWCLIHRVAYIHGGTCIRRTGKTLISRQFSHRGKEKGQYGWEIEVSLWPLVGWETLLGSAPSRFFIWTRKAKDPPMSLFAIKIIGQAFLRKKIPNSLNAENIYTEFVGALSYIALWPPLVASEEYLNAASALPLSVVFSYNTVLIVERGKLRETGDTIRYSHDENQNLKRGMAYRKREVIVVFYSDSLGPGELCPSLEPPAQEGCVAVGAGLLWREVEGVGSCLAWRRKGSLETASQPPSIEGSLQVWGGLTFYMVY